MKAKDIKQGAEYFSCAVRDWEANTYTGMSHGAVARVRVVDPVPGPWTTEKGGTLVKRAGYGYRTRNGVLVDLLNHETGEVVRRSVVTTASLRGPWKETWETVQDNARKAREAREARNAEHAAGLKRVEDALSALGSLADFHTGAYVQDANRAVVSVFVLERIIARLREGR